MNDPTCRANRVGASLELVEISRAASDYGFETVERKRMSNSPTHTIARANHETHAF
jgi:hypothetical protein